MARLGDGQQLVERRGQLIIGIAERAATNAIRPADPVESDFSLANPTSVLGASDVRVSIRQQFRDILVFSIETEVRSAKPNANAVVFGRPSRRIEVKTQASSRSSSLPRAPRSFPDARVRAQLAALGRQLGVEPTCKSSSCKSVEPEPSRG